MRFSFEQTNQCHRIHGGNPSTEEDLKNAIRDEWNISSYDPNIMEEFRVSGKTVHKVAFPFHREALLYNDCCNPHNSKDYFARLYQLLNDDNNEDYWKYLYTCFNDASTRTLELIFSPPHSLRNSVGKILLKCI